MYKTHLRTHTCNDLDISNINQKVKLAGWVNTKRDLGGVVFIDLRDYYGITQLVIHIDKDNNLINNIKKLSTEDVICIEGIVQERSDDTKNTNMKTGDIEVQIESLEILSKCKSLPFEIDKSHTVDEATRLKYRFLDLRNKRNQEILEFRFKMLEEIRQYFKKIGFIEYHTPILANPSPEGARDFLVPSRLNPHKFYALPQAPQQFKQLLMYGGIDKYFQIAPCFRDEDPRADRSPGEFYQLDLEMAFASPEDIFAILEPIMIHLTKFAGKKSTDFLRLKYEDAMNKYGSDKPDLRYDLHMEDISDVFINSEFKVFQDILQNKGVIKCIKIENSLDKISRTFIEEKLEPIAKENKAKGLIYIQIKDEWNSKIIKFINDTEKENLKNKLNLQKGDTLLIIAGDKKEVCTSLGALRSFLGDYLNLKDKNIVSCNWITDFPMFEWDEKNNKLDFSHNPFSMPQGGLEALKNQNPLDILAYQYDITANGYEIASGGVRNNNKEALFTAFKMVGYSEEELKEKFQHMITCLDYGVPPSAGIASGIERLIMIFQDLDNIRDTLPFPKTGKAVDLLTNSPSYIDKNQLKDLHIKLDK